MRRWIIYSAGSLKKITLITGPKRCVILRIPDKVQKSTEGNFDTPSAPFRIHEFNSHQSTVQDLSQDRKSDIAAPYITPQSVAWPLCLLPVPSSKPGVVHTSSRSIPPLKCQPSGRLGNGCAVCVQGAWCESDITTLHRYEAVDNTE
jgi:hypothetical protein